MNLRHTTRVGCTRFVVRLTAAWLLFPVILIAAAAGEPGATISSRAFGSMPDGRAVDLHVLKNRHGAEAAVTNLGATLVSLLVPDRNGNLADVVLGFDSAAGYLASDNPYFGSSVGRFAGRIQGGAFSLDGRDHRVSVNNGPNHLHGGAAGFDKKLWSAKVVPTAAGQALEFTYRSPDGEEGFPGQLTSRVWYQLTDENEVVITFHAVTDEPTLVNLTNHSYFNLGGHDSGNVLDHELTVFADFYAPAEAEWLIPTGELRKVEGTSVDFRSPRVIGDRVEQAPADFGGNNAGYDLNYALRNGGRAGLAARVRHPRSGRILEVVTSEPALQIYTSNFILEPIAGKAGAVYKKYAGLCLEPQHFPDAPNQPHLPSAVLRPGEIYQHTIIYRFSTQ